MMASRFPPDDDLDLDLDDGELELEATPQEWVLEADSTPVVVTRLGGVASAEADDEADTVELDLDVELELDDTPEPERLPEAQQAPEAPPAPPAPLDVIDDPLDDITRGDEVFEPLALEDDALAPVDVHDPVDVDLDAEGADPTYDGELEPLTVDEVPGDDEADQESLLIAAIEADLAARRPTVPSAPSAPPAPEPLELGEDDDVDDDDEDTVALDAPWAAPPPVEEEPGLVLDADLPKRKRPHASAPTLPIVRRVIEERQRELAASPAAPAVPVADNEAWLRLHPLTVAVNLLPQVWQVLSQFGLPLLALVFFGRRDREGMLFNGAVLGLLLVLGTVRTILHYLTLRYRLVGSRLEIRSGLISRTRRAIEVNKVQNVEVVSNLFHRWAGLAELRIETASGDDVEGMLSALSVAEAERLRVRLQAARKEAPGSVAEAGKPVLALTTTDLAMYGVTSTEIGGTAVVLGLLLDAGLVNDPEATSRFGAVLGAAGLFTLVLLVGAGAWVVGIFSALIRHHGFTMSRSGDTLVAQEGLFTRRRVELPVSKVQRVEVREPWARRWFGLASVMLETASARAGERGTQRSATMVPLIARDQVAARLASVLPIVRGLDLPLDRPAPAALRRALWRGLVRGLIFAAALAWWLGDWRAVAALVVVPISMALAWLDWKNQGWLVTEELVVARRGWLRRTTTVVARNKLQSVDVEQGFVMRRYGLGQVVLRVAGAEIAMPLIAFPDAWKLGLTLSANLGRRPA